MKISIVTISYNQAKFLEKAIKSVINQNYGQLEYIVVDAGSTDGSREIIEKYRSNIKKIIFEPDNGPADGLNKGFSFATGEVYGFLNSDDIYLQNTIKEVAEYFKFNRLVDVVSGHCNIINESGKMVRKAYSDKFSLERYAYRVCNQVQPSTFFRSEVYKKVNGFNLLNKISWDGELFIDIGIAGGNFRTINKFWSEYRVYSGSITANTDLNEKRIIESKRIFKKIKGREEKKYDSLIELAWRLYKHISNPKALIERLLKGAVVKKEN